MHIWNDYGLISQHSLGSCTKSSSIASVVFFVLLSLVFFSPAFGNSEVAVSAEQTPSPHCDLFAPQSLDGSCNNLRYPRFGAKGAPLLYLAGQHYAIGGDEALYFMREKPVEQGDLNTFPYVPSADATPGTCGPSDFQPECEFTIVADPLTGLGAKTKYNPRVLSNVLHDFASPFAPQDAQPVLNGAGLTNFFTRFSQVLAHDLQRLQPTVTPRRLRHGLPNQSDPSNATVLTGVPIIDPLDQFNINPIFTPRGVPESPAYRSMIVSGPAPIVQHRNYRKKRIGFVNSASAFVDGDTFYGSNEKLLKKLRAGEGGKFLLSSLTSPQVGPLPPLRLQDFPPSLAETGIREQADIDGNEAFTPSFADDRNLTTIGSATIHLLWLRFHNIQAERCRNRLGSASLDTQVGDQELFNCARKWTLATYQRIVFDEFLPAMTGRPLPAYHKYRPRLNPQISYSTLLGPLSLHSVPGELSAVAQPDGSVDQRLQIELNGQPNPPAGYFPFIGSLFPIPAGSAAFYFALSAIPAPLGDPTNPSTPWQLTEDPVAQQVRGLAYFAHEANDLIVTDSQRNIPANFGFDLISNNTFRNQQFGAANYFQARKVFVHGANKRIYGRPGCPRRLVSRDDIDDPVECFNYITEDLEQAQLVLDQLSDPLLGVRAKVKHLPLFSGIHMEKPIGGGILGVTGRAIIEEQFLRLRDADRWYYRNHLADEDIAEVETYTMAQVVRDVLGDDVGVQDEIFRLPPTGFFNNTLNP